MQTVTFSDKSGALIDIPYLLRPYAFI